MRIRKLGQEDSFATTDTVDIVHFGDGLRVAWVDPNGTITLRDDFTVRVDGTQVYVEKAE